MERNIENLAETISLVLFDDVNTTMQEYDQFFNDLKMTSAHKSTMLFELMAIQMYGVTELLRLDKELTIDEKVELASEIETRYFSEVREFLDLSHNDIRVVNAHIIQGCAFYKDNFPFDKIVSDRLSDFAMTAMEHVFGDKSESFNNATIPVATIIAQLLAKIRLLFEKI